MTYNKQTWINGIIGGTPISAARLNHMEDGIESAFSSSSRIDLETVGGDPTGVSSSSTALNTAKGTFSSGGIIDIPEGIFAFSDSSASPGTNNHIVGVGDGSIIKATDTSGSVFFINAQSHFSMSNFILDMGNVVQPISLYDCDNFILKGLKFSHLGSYGITLIRCRDFILEDIEGAWPSNNNTPPTLITMTNCRRGKIIRPKIISHFGTGVSQQGCHDISVIDADIDGQWFILPPRYSNSGGTVTYPSSTTLTDTTEPFAGATPSVSASSTIRAMPVRVASQSATSYESTRVLKTGATFIAAGVEEGDLVVAGGAYAMVDFPPTDTTILSIDGWKSRTDGLPIATPTSENFTVYRVLVASLTSITTTTITHSGFIDLNGTAITPSAGTQYEICFNHGAHAIFADGECKNTKILGGRLRRGWGDQINAQGDFTHVEGVTTEFGYDIGIGMEESGYGCSVVGNITRRNGTIGIWAGNDALIVGNVCVDNGWNTSDVNLGSITLVGSRCSVSGNRLLKRNLTNSKYPILVVSQATDADKNQVGINLATGYSTTLIGLHPGTTNITNTQAISLSDITNIAGVGSVSGSIALGANFRAIPTGSVSAPGLAFANDPDTGIYEEFTGQMDLVTDGASRVSLSAGGIIARSTLMPDADFGRSLGFSGRSWYEYYGYNAHLSNGIGVWGHAIPGAQPATPVTLADVIAVLQAYGLTA